MIFFLVGLLVGMFLGVLIMCLVSIGQDDNPTSTSPR
jgi:hypothetical protein